MKQTAAPIISVSEVLHGIHIIRMEAPEIAAEARPGQFIMVRVNTHHLPLLRRPLSIHSKNENTIEIFFQISGLGTDLLSQKKLEDSIDILGPLGKGFEAVKELRGKDVAVVGGGRGIAPLYFLIQELHSIGASARIFYGGKSQEDLPLKEKFKKTGFDLSCSTDDGSFGFKGFVSDFFNAELKKFTPDRIFACGPDLVIRAGCGLYHRGMAVPAGDPHRLRQILESSLKEFDSIHV